MRSRLLPCVALAALVLTNGCSPTTEPASTTPVPAIPATLAFTGGGSLVALGAAASAQVSPGGILGEAADETIARPCSSFVHAAVQVGTWSIAAGASLAVPVALTAAALQTTPTYTRTRGDGETYTWTTTRSVTDTTGLTRTYGATLTAHIVAGLVHWQLRVSGELPTSLTTSVTLTDFPWYDGEMPLAATSGWWQFLDARTPSTQTPAMRVAWSTLRDTLSVGYLNQRAGTAAGDSLRYALAGTHATFDMWTAASATRAFIVADTTTWAGSLARTPGSTTCWSGRVDNFACVDCVAGVVASHRRGSMRNSR